MYIKDIGIYVGFMRSRPELRDDHHRLLDTTRWQYELPALGAHVKPTGRRGLPLAIGNPAAEESMGLGRALCRIISTIRIILDITYRRR